MSEQGLSRRQKRIKRQEEADLRFILDNPQGRRFLMRVLDTCGVVGPSYGHDTDYKEGRRSVGLELINAMESITQGAFVSIQLEMLKLRMQEDEDNG